MIDNLHSLPIFLALLPIIVGVVWKVAKISISNMRSIGLATIAVLGILLFFAVEIDSPIKLLACAVLLSSFCVMFSQGESQQASNIFPSIMTILGLTLGALLIQGVASRLFLCGILGFAAFSLVREKHRSFRTILIIIHFIIAIILSFSSSLGGESLQMISSLFLTVTFLPLVPFHLPFVGTVKGAKGTLSSFWIVVWLSVGLAELRMIHSSLTTDMLFVLSLLALVSAFFASLAALGQKQINMFIATATVAHVSLLWGLLSVFPSFSNWVIGFGIAVAFVLGGIGLAFSFVRHRYGWQIIGKLPGLASPMPRLGTAIVLLVSFALFLPMVPIFAGLTVMPTIDTSDVKLFNIILMYLAVWLGGGWFFIQLLHQTVFGAARANVPYSDLRIAEFVAIVLLLLGAGYSGILY